MPPKLRAPRLSILRQGLAHEAQLLVDGGLLLLQPVEPSRALTGDRLEVGVFLLELVTGGAVALDQLGVGLLGLAHEVAAPPEREASWASISTASIWVCSHV